METRDLTPRQKDILDFIREFNARRGYPPTLRDICARFNIKGPKNAGKHLDALARKGFLRRRAGVSRGIDLGGGALTKAVSIPIAGRVRAGSPHLAVEDIAGRVTLDEGFFNCRDAFLLRVEGESMTGAGLDPGDLVLVRPGVDVADNDIVVAVIDGEATVKRFFREGETIVLRPENPAFEPLSVSGDRQFHLAGKVTCVIKKIS